MKKWNVKLDVFFMDSAYVEAKTKKEAIEKAKNEIEGRYGMGAELTLFEISEDK